MAWFSGRTNHLRFKGSKGKWHCIKPGQPANACFYMLAYVRTGLFLLYYDTIRPEYESEIGDRVEGLWIKRHTGLFSYNNSIMCQLHLDAFEWPRPEQNIKATYATLQ